MNKQQLASRIWRATNKMRSKIEASEYKDYILGFIFYRFLSEQEERFCLARGWSQDEMREELNEDNAADANNIRENLGYFISYKDLYSTWLAEGSEFSVDNVRTALSAFSRNIYKDNLSIYEGVFKTLEQGLSNLGTTTGQQTKAVSELLALIKPIPMDAKQGYDVLGYIYEYLLRNFAAHAGKKAGEFYTPHEVAVMMSQIIAYRLRGKDEIGIYDPTSGSASLLITVGNAVAQANGNPEGIRYYAQELKSNTYNLTRMNLVMHDVRPANIVTRNADTLEEDWPLRIDDKEGGGSDNKADEPLRVDACTSNPPYSQPWDSKDRENDPRFDGYGIAPKGKSDYAFLLHCLYHLKPGGVMTIVLPHGVLFRGDSEAEIRRALVDRNEIEAIIGLPPNVFYGTQIPTVVMVLRKRDDAETDQGDGSILIIDAARFYEKDGTKNRLRAGDIKRIVDLYIARHDVERLCRVVPKKEIIANDYNLNLPRYVDSSDPVEPWDLYATMFGGVPDAELDSFSDWWEAFPGLRESIFSSNDGYSHTQVEDISTAIREHPSAERYRNAFEKAFSGFADGLFDRIVRRFESVNVNTEEDIITKDIFARLDDIPLIDRYAAYQAIDRRWNGREENQGIADGIRIMQEEGFKAVRKVDPHLVLKKVKNDGGEDEEREVVDTKDPWVGHVLSFDIVRKSMFPNDLTRLDALDAGITADETAIEELFETLDDEEVEGDYTNDTNTAFAYRDFDRAIPNLVANENDEVGSLLGYLDLLDKQSAALKLIPHDDTAGKKSAKALAKQEKLEFISNHNDVSWESMKATGGVYAASKVKTHIWEIIRGLDLDSQSLVARLLRAQAINEDVKSKKTAAKKLREDLIARTREQIEKLSDDEAYEMLRICWVEPIIRDLSDMPNTMIETFSDDLQRLVDKYATTLKEIACACEQADHALSTMLPSLTGDSKDEAGLHELASLLGGEA